jgi:hypothetical protein
MNRHASIILALPTTLLLFNTATAEGIISDKPTPSRAEWAPLGYAYGRDYSTSDVTKVVVIGSGTPAADPRHGGISVAVVVNGQPYIIDCGPGFWRNSQVKHSGVRWKNRCPRTEESDPPVSHPFAF